MQNEAAVASAGFSAGGWCGAVASKRIFLAGIGVQGFEPDFTVTLNPDPPLVTTGPDNLTTVAYTVTTSDFSGNPQTIVCQAEILDDIAPRHIDCPFFETKAFHVNLPSPNGLFYPSPFATGQEAFDANSLPIPYFEDNVQLYSMDFGVDLYPIGPPLELDLNSQVGPYAQPYSMSFLLNNTNYVPTFGGASGYKMIASNEHLPSSLNANCLFFIEILDEVAPVILGCPLVANIVISSNDTAYCDVSGSSCNYSVTYNVTDAFALGEGDNVSAAIAGAVRGTLSTEHTVTFTGMVPGETRSYSRFFSDLTPNTDDCTFDVTVLDSVAPFITCDPDDLIFYARENIDGQQGDLDFLFPNISATDHGGMFTASCDNGPRYRHHCRSWP